ncbi:MAG TPA: hypothetical protein VF855_02330 [Acidimicrobiales bacterium]
MTTIFVTSWQIARGRANDVLAQVATAREIQRRHGFGVSAWRGVVTGGEAADLWYVMISAGIDEHFQQVLALQADAEWQEFVASSIDVADPAATLLSDALWRTSPDLPEVVLIPSKLSPQAQLVTNYAPMGPDQRAFFASSIPHAASILQRHGLHSGFADAMVAGPRTGMVSSVVSAPSLTDLSKGIAALQDDADWLAYQRDMATRRDRPELVSRMIRQEIM